MTAARTVIAGAGLSGLAAARHLPRGTFRIAEAEREAGGLCRSIRQDGFTFDYTGHLLHLKGETLGEVERLLGNNLAVISRRAVVHTHGREFPYPFQAHLHGLPPEIRDECLEAFEAVARREVDATNFATWNESTFGSGITRHFMRPYNEKLLCRPLEALTADWVHYIPRPKLDEIRAGAHGEIVEKVGYNAEFRYPIHGGIGVLPAALAKGLPIELGAPLGVWNAGERRVQIGSDWQLYDRLITTIPLPLLVRGAEDVTADVLSAADALEASGVLCLNLGIHGSTRDAHWMYFPEPKYCFFRVGFYHNIAPSSAPPGKSALYVEISYDRREHVPADIETRAIRDLEAAGIIDDPRRVETCVPVWIDSAYALPTPERSKAMRHIEPWLAAHNVLPIGRYGRWAYTSMGEALREGREAAEDSSRIS